MPIFIFIERSKCALDCRSLPVNFLWLDHYSFSHSLIIQERRRDKKWPILRHWIAEGITEYSSCTPTVSMSNNVGSYSCSRNERALKFNTSDGVLSVVKWLKRDVIGTDHPSCIAIDWISAWCNSRLRSDGDKNPIWSLPKKTIVPFFFGCQRLDFHQQVDRSNLIYRLWENNRLRMQFVKEKILFNDVTRLESLLGFLLWIDREHIRLEFELVQQV